MFAALKKLTNDPMTRRRIQRFRSHKRALWSLRILTGLYILSLGAELICNDKPLFVRFEGNTYFPIVRYYPDDVFTGSGKKTRPDYRELENAPVFSDREDNFMVFPPVPFSPYENIPPELIQEEQTATLVLRPVPRVATVNIDTSFVIETSRNAGFFFDAGDNDVQGRQLTDRWPIPKSVQAAITARFANREAERVEVPLVSRDGSCHATLTLSRFRERSRPPQSVRMTFREMISEHNAAARIVFTPSLTVRGQPPELWHSLQPKERDFLQAYVAENFDRPALRQTKTFSGISYQVELEKNDVSYPHPPVKGHWFGFDDAGRDVFARVFYGFRVSVTFGLVLVTVSMLLGTVMGAVQGYRGGKTDIFMQRLIEIWSTLPFLYVMILMGAVFGRGLLILMVCYGLFNWIGISYYMRAEFLRLRGQPFVEAARCMGIPAHKIMYRHILPNAVTPVITFFPFSLVSAVYALVALDYLGFGLPPPMPSWGELLHQAQTHRDAWWLILYPSLSLFAVMLLGVFIGEGIREAFDPRQYSKME